MFDLAGYFSAIKRHWLPFAVTIVLVTVFFSATIVGLYRKVRSAVPGASAVLPAK